MSIVSTAGRVFFSGGNVTATTNYIYTPGGGTTATAGWLSCTVDSVAVQVSVATLNRTGSIFYRIEGKFPTFSRAASLHTEAVNTVHAIDKIISITPKVSQIRIGVKGTVTPASLTGSPCNFYAGLLKSEAR
jgi:hypothetical protein